MPWWSKSPKAFSFLYRYVGRFVLSLLRILWMTSGDGAAENATASRPANARSSVRRKKVAGRRSMVSIWYLDDINSRVCHGHLSDCVWVHANLADRAWIFRPVLSENGSSSCSDFTISWCIIAEVIYQFLLCGTSFDHLKTWSKDNHTASALWGQSHIYDSYRSDQHHVDGCTSSRVRRCQ